MSLPDSSPYHRWHLFCQPVDGNINIVSDTNKIVKETREISLADHQQSSPSQETKCHFVSCHNTLDDEFLNEYGIETKIGVELESEDQKLEGNEANEANTEENHCEECNKGEKSESNAFQKASRLVREFKVRDDRRRRLNLELDRLFNCLMAIERENESFSPELIDDYLFEEVFEDLSEFENRPNFFSFVKAAIAHDDAVNIKYLTGSQLSRLLEYDIVSEFPERPAVPTKYNFYGHDLRYYAYFQFTCPQAPQHEEFLRILDQANDGDIFPANDDTFAAKDYGYYEKEHNNLSFLTFSSLLPIESQKQKRDLEQSAFENRLINGFNQDLPICEKRDTPCKVPELEPESLENKTRIFLIEKSTTNYDENLDENQSESRSENHDKSSRQFLLYKPMSHSSTFGGLRVIQQQNQPEPERRTNNCFYYDQDLYNRQNNPKIRKNSARSKKDLPGTVPYIDDDDGDDEDSDYDRCFSVVCSDFRSSLVGTLVGTLKGDCFHEVCNKDGNHHTPCILGSFADFIRGYDYFLDEVEKLRLYRLYNSLKYPDQQTFVPFNVHHNDYDNANDSTVHGSMNGESSNLKTVEGAEKHASGFFAKLKRVFKHLGLRRRETLKH